MSYITLNKQNYFYNLDQALKRVDGINKLIIILKDNAYGHGIDEISSFALEFGAKFVAVKNQFEAEQIKDKFENIFILSQLPQNYSARNNYILAINDLRYFDFLNKNDKVALKLDTSMHRSGLEFKDLEEALKIIKVKKLKLVSAFTHYSSPKNIKKQKEIYKKMKEFLEQNYDEEIFFHSANSSTLFLGENDLDKAARVGLAQFGYCDAKCDLKPVLSLYAEKISKRILKQGESLGYDEVFIALKDLKIANYDLGYADGLMYYKGVGDVYLSDDKSLILGKISMDSFSTYDSGDKLCVFNDANKFAKYFNTSAYEVLVRLNQNIKKVIV